LKDVHVSKGDPIKEITWGSFLLVVGLYLTGGDGDYKDIAYAMIAIALIFLDHSFLLLHLPSTLSLH